MSVSAWRKMSARMLALDSSGKFPVSAHSFDTHDCISLVIERFASDPPRQADHQFLNSQELFSELIGTYVPLNRKWRFVIHLDSVDCNMYIALARTTFPQMYADKLNNCGILYNSTRGARRAGVLQLH